MTKYEIWKNLKEQTHQAKKERDEKQKEITTCEWNCEDKSCIKIIQVQNKTVEDQTNTDIIERYCDNFDSKLTCTDTTCPFRNKNAEYVLANLKFKAIRTDKRRAFWKMFQRSM